MFQAFARAWQKIDKLSDKERQRSANNQQQINNNENNTEKNEEWPFET